MGRLNKKLQQKERKKIGGSGISKSAVLATLAERDKKKSDEADVEKDPNRYNAINFKQPKKLPNSLDELDNDPEFQLLLDVPSFKDKSNRKPGTFNESNRVKKKDKMKIKKDLLRKKLHVCELLKKEETDAKVRKNTAVVGDMKPITDSLKVIDEDIEAEKKVKKLAEKSAVAKKAKGTQKQKKAKQDFLKNISIFNQVNKHPDYVKNPLLTISTHIENKMILESIQCSQDNPDK